MNYSCQSFFDKIRREAVMRASAVPDYKFSNVVKKVFKINIQLVMDFSAPKHAYMYRIFFLLKRQDQTFKTRFVHYH